VVKLGGAADIRPRGSVRSSGWRDGRRSACDPRLAGGVGRREAEEVRPAA